MRVLLAACLLPALLAACATTPAVPAPSVPAVRPVPDAIRLEDPFDARYKVHCDTESGTTVCVMTGNALRPLSPRYPLLSLGLMSEAPTKGSTRYFIRVLYIGEGTWLNIGRGATATIAIDGDPVPFAGDGSAGSRFTGEGGKTYEVALYATGAETIRRIAAAREVRVTLRGDSPLEKSFGAVNSLYFQQFVRHYIDAGPAAPR
jgi:hypothetical protein